MPRILIIDDDSELSELVTEFLQPEGFQVDSVHSGTEGLRQALSDNYDLLILDVMLPGMNGMEILRHIRSSTGKVSLVPVLMLTARGEATDRIAGLELGADDYLPKPFNPTELSARIHAILRRATPSRISEAITRIVVDDVELDIGARTVRLGDALVILTSAEFDILRELLLEAGRAVSRDELAQRVFGRRLMPYERSIDVHISNIRKKFGNSISGAERIKTVRSLGYIYTPEGAE